MNHIGTAAGYDVIGELRASQTRLDALLEHLGYRRVGGGPWTHPGGRTAVFVGGVVGAGGRRGSCAAMVQAMVDAGSALMVLGPHELQVVLDAARRPRTRELALVGIATGSGGEASVDADDALVAWLRTVPIWLDLPGLRVVHACWSEFDIAELRAGLDGNCLADDEALQACATPGSALHAAIRTVVHGPDVALPPHLDIRDAQGRAVRRARYRWWVDGPITLRHRALLPAGSTAGPGPRAAELDDTPIVEAMPVWFADESPVIVGQSGFPGSPPLRTPRLLSLDHTSEHPRQTTAYRWSGEGSIDPSRLVHLA